MYSEREVADGPRWISKSWPGILRLICRSPVLCEDGDDPSHYVTACGRARQSGNVFARRCFFRDSSIMIIRHPCHDSRLITSIPTALEIQLP